MASVQMKAKSGEVEQITQENFAAWKRRVGKDMGFVVKDADSEMIVLTRGQMRALPEGVFEAELVRRYAIEDPILKRGYDVWKCA